MVKVIQPKQMMYTCSITEARKLIDLKSRSIYGFQLCNFSLKRESEPYEIWYKSSGRYRIYETTRYIPVSRVFIDVISNYKEVCIEDFNKYILPEIKGIKGYKELILN